MNQDNRCIVLEIDGNILSSGIHYGSMTLTEILSDSESYDFYGCVSNMFECTIDYPQECTGKSLRVINIDTDDVLFTGYIETCNVMRNKSGSINSCSIVAYDILYNVANINIDSFLSDFLNNENKSERTVKKLRDSLCNLVGITQVDKQLGCDNIVLTNHEYFTLKGITFIQMMKYICQINGVYGNINRNGLMDYVRLWTNTNNKDLTDNIRTNSSDTSKSPSEHFYAVFVKATDGLNTVIGSADTSAATATSRKLTIDGNYIAYLLDNNYDLNRIAESIARGLDGLYTPKRTCGEVSTIISDLTIKLGDMIQINEYDTPIDDTVDVEIGTIDTVNTYIPVMQNVLTGVQLYSQTISAFAQVEGDIEISGINDGLFSTEDYSEEIEHLSNRVDYLITSDSTESNIEFTEPMKDAIQDVAGGGGGGNPNAPDMPVTTNCSLLRINNTNSNDYYYVSDFSDEESYLTVCGKNLLNKNFWKTMLNASEAERYGVSFVAVKDGNYAVYLRVDTVSSRTFVAQVFLNNVYKRTISFSGSNSMPLNQKHIINLSKGEELRLLTTSNATKTYVVYAFACLGDATDDELTLDFDGDIFLADNRFINLRNDETNIYVSNGTFSIMRGNNEQGKLIINKLGLLEAMIENKIGITEGGISYYGIEGEITVSEE